MTNQKVNLGMTRLCTLSFAIAFAAIPLLASQPKGDLLRAMGGHSHRANAEVITIFAKPRVLPSDVLKIILRMLPFHEQLTMRQAAKRFKGLLEQLYGPLFLDSSMLKNAPLGIRLAREHEKSLVPFPLPKVRTAQIRDVVCEAHHDTCEARLMFEGKCLKSFNLNKGYPEQPAAFGNYFYVPRMRALTVVDVETLKLIKTHHFGTYVCTPVLVNGLLYVVVPEHNTVFGIDPATQERRVAISIGEGEWPYDHPIDQSPPAVFGHKLYVPSLHLKTLSIIDTNTNKVMKTISLGGKPRMAIRVRHLIFVQINTEDLYIINALDDTVVDIVKNRGIRIQQLSGRELVYSTVTQSKVLDISALLGRWLPPYPDRPK